MLSKFLKWIFEARINLFDIGVMIGAAVLLTTENYIWSIIFVIVAAIFSAVTQDKLDDN